MDENIGEGAMCGQLRKVFPNDSTKKILWKALEKKITGYRQSQYSSREVW